MEIIDRVMATQPYMVLCTDDFHQEKCDIEGVSHFYSCKVKGNGKLTIVPDGCFDILFIYDKNEMKAYACGSVITFTEYELPVGAELFGVRFLPGVQPAGLKKTMHDMLGRMDEITDEIWNTDLVFRLSFEKDFKHRMYAFTEEYMLLKKKHVRPFGKVELVTSIKDMVYESDGLVRVSELAERTGYSERYINKVFIEQMGFSPKTFCKIIQFQRALEYLNLGQVEKMNDAAITLGYYDQPQFIRDFERYCGITPSRYLKWRTAKLESA